LSVEPEVLGLQKLKVTVWEADARWLAWGKAFPDVIPKLGMDAANVIDLDTPRETRREHASRSK